MYSPPKTIARSTRRTEFQNRALGTAAANFNSVNVQQLQEEMRAAVIAHDTAKLAELRKQVDANAADSNKRVQLITSMQNARCVPK